MTTIDYKIATFNDIIVKMEPTNYKRERKKTFLAIANIIVGLVLPVVIAKNAMKLIRATIGKSKAKSLVVLMYIAIDNASTEQEKMELYADFQYLQEVLNLEKTKEGGYLTNAINKKRHEIAKIINQHEPILYRKVYPNNPDHTSKEFIEHVKRAHSQADLQLT